MADVPPQLLADIDADDARRVVRLRQYQHDVPKAVLVELRQHRQVACELLAFALGEPFGELFEGVVGDLLARICT